MRSKNSVIALLLVLCCALAFTPNLFAQKKGARVQKITFKRYPDLKLGFLANNFYKPLPLGKDNLKKIFDWAVANGFWWVEIRDNNADLSYADCKELAAYAASKKLEIVYAMGIGFLDPKFNECFYRGVANAALFKGPNVIRTSAPGPEFNADPKKSTWTKDEFATLLPIANNAANIAKLAGLQLVIEHAFEAMAGDGVNSFGMEEIQTMGNSNVGSQYDTANFFAVSRAPVDAESVRLYFEKFAKKTGYAHLKTSDPSTHKVTNVLGDNELDFETIFDIFANAGINYVAIELPPQAKMEDVAANLKASVAYLESKF
jgi:sugar phosphate isomerase/epimerase